MSYCSYMQTSLAPRPSPLADQHTTQSLADLFRLLGDPTRLRIVDAQWQLSHALIKAHSAGT